MAGKPANRERKLTPYPLVELGKYNGSIKKKIDPHRLMCVRDARVDETNLLGESHRMLEGGRRTVKEPVRCHLSFSLQVQVP